MISVGAFDTKAPVVVGVLSFDGGLVGTLNKITGVSTNGDVQWYWREFGRMCDINTPTVIIKTFYCAINNILDDTQRV